MSSDSDWLQEVRRWYQARSSSGPHPSRRRNDGEPASDSLLDVGYEAADPALQVPHGFDIHAMAGRSAHLR